jgi:glycosyltransferase involved in cell wall biosynthesis
MVVVVERSETINVFVNQYSSRYPKKVYFTKEKLGVSNARNVGVDISRGDIIAFVDDDAVLSPDWSVKLIESFYNYPRAIGVTGKAVPVGKSVDLRGFPKSLYWAIGCTEQHDSGQHYTNFASGVNMAFRREAFDTHRFMLNIIGDSRGRSFVYGGLPNDENDFAVRLTTDLAQPILYNSNLIVFHKVYPDRINIKFLRQYSFWQGFAEARYRTDVKWKKVRNMKYMDSFKILSGDIFSMQGGIELSVRRLAFVFTALFFVTIGFFSYKSRSVCRIGQSML